LRAAESALNRSLALTTPPAALPPSGAGPDACIRPGKGSRAFTLAAWAAGCWFARRGQPALPLLRGPDAWLRTARVLSIPSHERTAAPTAAAILESVGWETSDLLTQAASAMAAMVAARVGADCCARDPGAAALGLPAHGLVLVVLQDDRDPAGLPEMIAAVARKHDAGKVLAVAPSARPGTRAWRRVSALAIAQGWRMIEEPVSPWTLLDAAESVYTVGHEIGFLALLKGLKVRCFGRPFYAGWGATEDDAAVAPRSRRRSVAEIFAAHCLLATRYVNPFTGRDSSFEEACALLADWRRVNEANREIAVCLGMSFWKRRRIRDLLRSSAGAPLFRRSASRAVAAARARGGAVAVWAAREPPDLAAAAQAAGVPIVRIEDGFLRSVGLGADFIPGVSVVADRRGIYFDPTTASDLEIILSTASFAPALRDRARRLTHLLVARGITKYNTGGLLPDLAAPQGVRRLFVPGQVEDDRSVTLGGAGIAGNLDLLMRVRAANPDAFIVYKPHPDVDAGHRQGAVPDGEARRFADRVLRNVSSAALIDTVDEVHTLTSLCGFEALLRRRRVTVYGRPFYAGWGLTIDLAPIPRRTRRLSLEELVAGALILYPRYLDPVTRLPCGPEMVIERLSHPDLWRPGLLVRLRRLQGAIARRLRLRNGAPNLASAR